MKKTRKVKVKNNTYYLDNQNDFEQISSVLLNKDVALIGRGQSKDWYTFNMEKMNCLWLSENHLERIKRIYSDNISGHYYCINGLHPDIRERVIEEMGGVLDCLTFKNTAEPLHHRKGSGPAFLYYLCEMFKKSDKKIYMSGCDCNNWTEGPVFMPGDSTPRKKSFKAETDGYMHVWRSFPEMRERIFDLSSNERMNFQKMTDEQKFQDNNIVYFPGLPEIAKGEK